MSKVILGVLILYLATACTPVPKKPDTKVLQRINQFVEYELNLTPRRNQPILLPGNRGCVNGNGNKDGCLRFEQGDYGVIVFSVGAPGQDNKVCGDPGANWVITEILITDTGSVDTGKGTNFGTPVADWVEDALYPFEDASTGTLYKRTWLAGATPTGDTRVGVLNRNDNDSNDPKDFWYQVTATLCDDDSITSETDPRVENNGR